jgi:hypothetical protein
VSEQTLRYHLEFGIDEYENVGNKQYEYVVERFRALEAAAKEVIEERYDSDGEYLSQAISNLEAVLTANDAGAEMIRDANRLKEPR